MQTSAAEQAGSKGPRGQTKKGSSEHSREGCVGTGGSAWTFSPGLPSIWPQGGIVSPEKLQTRRTWSRVLAVTSGKRWLQL